ncbi:Stage III sporulation protein AE [Candidatus Hydrogenisulfobacillus filiaventi]|uniref:Stage III sporulation protein AE n=1 Tax=Candidatus Hydrogenisulfobacillus filiaventi TaxID=2707344 RepID=A0A6F8ZH44_9FIRM|nr:stage III sporulation protein AE [Bacillota bacterium]CAB1128912.1 Stage III sporulation protein AE [Candidatus Hydrogenisulfobacillus filiaventi]
MRWRTGLGVLAGILFLAWGPATPAARAAGPQAVLSRELQSLNTGPLDAYLRQLTASYPGARLPTPGEVARDLLQHRAPVSPGDLLRLLRAGLVGDVAADFRVVGLILVLTVFAALLERLGAAFEAPAVAQVAEVVVVSGILLISLRSFALALGLVQGVVTHLVGMMEALIPLLVVLMVGSGSITAAGIFHPWMVAAVNVVAVLVRQWVLPLILFATVLELLGTWLPRFSLRHVANLFRQAGGALLGGLLTVFLGVMAVQGAAGAVADGVSLRATKFLANTFVPVIGKIFSDAMEAVLGSSLLLKSAVSIVGALAIIVTVAFPLLKLFVMMFLYRLGAAGSEPLGVGPVSQALAALANAMGWMIAVGGAVALMFFLVITVVVSASNGVGL